MHIKLSPSVSPLGLPASRVALAPRATLEQQVPTTVTLSETSRSFAASMLELAYASGCQDSFHVLELADRAVLTFARQLAEELRLPPCEVHKLVFDLCRYRLGEPLDKGTAEPRSDGRLALLPALPADDEQLARSILSSMALRDTPIDRAFLGSLLDPARTDTPRVDFSFLRQLVLASSPSYTEGALDPRVSLAQRDARTKLAQAVAGLAPLLVISEDVARLSLREGPALLLQRLFRAHAAQPGAGDPPQATGADRREASASSTPQAAPGEAPPLVQNAAPMAPSQPREQPDFRQLTRQDRAVLGLLYTAAARQGRDLHAVDELAHAVVALRRSERSGPAPEPARRPGPSAGEHVVAGPQAANERLQSAPAAQTSPALTREAATTMGAHALQQPVEPQPGRAYESAAQLLTRSVGSYRSFSSPSTQRPAAPLHALSHDGVRTAPRLPVEVEAALALGAARQMTIAGHSEPKQALSLTCPRLPLDLAQALGVATLLERARLRPVLRRRTRSGTRAVEHEERLDADRESAQDERAPNSGRQGRWQLLLVRRRRTRLRQLSRDA